MSAHDKAPQQISDPIPTRWRACTRHIHWGPRRLPVAGTRLFRAGLGGRGGTYLGMTGAGG